MIDFITEESFLQHMNITIIYSLINLIKMENYVQKIIKGSAKLSVAHWLKVFSLRDLDLHDYLYTKYHFRYLAVEINI